MNIERLRVSKTKIDSLKSIPRIKGLRELHVSETQITSLNHLQGLNVEFLYFLNCNVLDLDTLRKMPRLNSVWYDVDWKNDAKLLRSLPGLKNINGLNRDQFFTLADRLDPTKNDAKWRDAINLLPLVQSDLDTESGVPWKLDSNGLNTVQNDNFSMLALPYMPPEEYDLRLVLLPKQFGNFRVLLPKGENHLSLLISQTRLFMGSLNPPLQFGMGATPSLRHEFIIQVRNTGIQVLFNNDLVFEIPADRIPSMYGSRNDSLKKTGRLGLGTQYAYRALVERLQIREISGPGTFARPNDPAVQTEMRKRKP